MKRAVAVLLLAAAIATVAAGCGGGSSSSGSGPGSQDTFTPYENAMLALGGKLSMALTDVGKANRNATNRATIERNLHKSQLALRAAAAKLAKITPPAEIKAQHLKLIRGVREYADELDGVIAKLKHGQDKRILGTIPRLKGVKDMSLATQAIMKAGYIIYISGS